MSGLAVLTFSEALTLAQATGAKIARAGWNGKGQYVQEADHATVFLKTPVGSPGMAVVESGSFLVLCNVAGEFVPWVPSQGDMTAVDWMTL
jgi:hypothetical protein